MATLLWIDTEKEQTIDLGDPFRLWGVFGEIAKACGNDYGRYPELFEVVEVAESQEDCDSDWLEKVKLQAADYLKSHADRLGPTAREILELLRKGEPT